MSTTPPTEPLTDSCPRCHSPQPHLHPAVQHEGEVQPCPHPFHEQITPSNTAERVAAHREWLADSEPEWVAAIPDDGDRAAVRAVLARKRWREAHGG